MNMAIAIIAHKGAASLSLGISLVKTFPNDFKTVRLCVFLFGIATPIGVVIGMILANQGELINIIFSCLAAGTFLYIACSEVIIEEFAIADYKWWKFLFYLLGALLISLLWFIERGE